MDSLRFLNVEVYVFANVGKVLVFKIFFLTVSSMNKVTQTFNIKGFDVSNKSEALFLFCFPIYFFSVVQCTSFHCVQFSISA